MYHCSGYFDTLDFLACCDEFKFDFVNSRWFKPSVVQDTQGLAQASSQFKPSVAQDHSFKFKGQASQAQIFKLLSCRARCQDE
jgi:hypothetical protein